MIHLEAMKRKSILVIGDVMLDNYYTGDIKRISPEAPVPIYRKINERFVLGGAANVAANLVAANQDVSMMSIIGEDECGHKLLSLFKEKNVGTDLMEVTSRQTTQKTRFLAGNNQQVLRLDVEDTTPISSELCKRLLNRLDSHIMGFNLIVMSDYLKGLLTMEFTQGVIKLAKEHGIPIVIDVKDPCIIKYCGATLLKPNQKELHDLTGLPVDTDEEIVMAAEYLRNKCNNQYVLCTCGARGMVLVGNKKPAHFVPAECREVFDVSGAGDTTIAYLAASMANGIEMDESVAIANYAAGIQVGKVGTSSVYLHEVRDYLSNEDTGSFHKILTTGSLPTFREENKGKTIVFTNGCFDIFHVGHKRYLEQASALGDVFIIGVNSDASVRRLKGTSRPVNHEQDRMEILSALGFVDYVVLFDEDTPYELIKKIQPDVLVKGGDYTIEDVVGRDIVEARGGRVELIPYVEGKSTTNIIKKINNNG
jgi:D-beta-D-heptose 7-phosphate kinase/D-beta-D-heptose 1-phosphate adenosyltransferase